MNAKQRRLARRADARIIGGLTHMIPELKHVGDKLWRTLEPIAARHGKAAWLAEQRASVERALCDAERLLAEAPRD